MHLTQLGGVLRPLFLSLCEKDGLSVEWAESESQIRFCYTILTQDSVTELVEESEAVAAGTEQRLLTQYDSIIGDVSRNIKFLVISGTKAAGFSDTLIPAMVRKAKEKGIKAILDIKGKDLIESLQYSPYIVKPNLYEFASTFAPELVENNDLINYEKARQKIISVTMDFVKKYGCSIVLTNGSRKILAVNAGAVGGEKFYEIDIQPVKAVNTIGCGDAFTAGLACALDNGANFEDAINEGIRCGALNAGFLRPGVVR